MFILPFIHKKLSNTIHSVQFFLSKGGSALLSIPSDPVEFCRENDIPVLRTFTLNNIVFLEVDSKVIQKDAFYTFNETDTQSVEVWRNFVWAGTVDTDPWSVNSFLSTLILSGFKVSNLMEAVLRNVTYI